MGAEDVERQALNVLRMQLLGAKVHAVDVGHAHAQGRDERGAARLGHERRDTLLPHRLGRRAAPVSDDGARSAGGDRPRGARAAARARRAAARRVRRLRRRRLERDGAVPRLRRRRRAWQLFGVEAAGEGIATGRHAATLSAGRVGVLHGSKSYVLTDDDGQILPAHSISAGLDYPGRRARARLAQADGPRHLRRRSPTTRRSTALQLLGAHRGHPVRARDRARDRLSAAAVRRRWATRRSWSSRSRAAATRTCRRWPRRWGSSRERGAAVVNRLVARMRRARAPRNEKALVVYLTAGDPSLAETPALLAEVARAGADVIELGVPLSDPSADGPVIQRAMERALATGGAAPDTLRQDARGRARVPPGVARCRSCSSATTTRCLQRGLARVAGEARDAGVDGFLVVDLPPEESGELDDALAARRAVARAAAGADDLARAGARRSSSAASGFAYYVALTGVTGAGHLDLADVGASRPRRCVRRSARCRSRSASACATRRAPARWRAHCDAVVVGSALVAGDRRGARRRRTPPRRLRLRARAQGRAQELSINRLLLSLSGGTFPSPLVEQSSDEPPSTARFPRGVSQPDSLVSRWFSSRNKNLTSR